MIVFVGEKRSKRAIELGVTWQDRALASKTLHRALKRVFRAGERMFLNLWDDAGRLDKKTVDNLRLAVALDRTVVGLGRVVQAKLEELEIPHTKMIHPAARGAIRKTERYIDHVSEVLNSPAEAHLWRPKKK